MKLLRLMLKKLAPNHYYGITTQEGGTIVPSDTSNLAYVFQARLG